MPKTKTVEQTSFRWPDRRRGPWAIQLTWGQVEGRVECVGFHVGSVGRRQPVTSTVLRSIPLASLIEEKRAARSKWLRDNVTTEQKARQRREFAETVRSLGIKYREVPAKRRGGRPRIEPEKLAEVAEVYDDAFQRGDSAPTRAVANHFDMPYSTASKWVMRAREMDLLARTEKRQARGRPARSRRKR